MNWTDQEVLKFLNWYLKFTGETKQATSAIVEAYKRGEYPNNVHWTIQICKYYGVTMNQIRSKTHKHAFQRHLIAFLYIKKGLSLNKIGEKINRDHSSVAHAKRVMGDYLETDFKKRGEILKWIEIMKKYEKTVFISSNLV